MFAKLRYLLIYWLNMAVVKFFLFPHIKHNELMLTFGNPGAQWKIPVSCCTARSICYCAGVGEDISFEQELYKEKSPHIFLFDPTPRAIDYIATQKLPRKIRFLPWGLWSKNSKQKFFVPSVESFVSHSIVNLHQTKKYFTAECKHVGWIMKKFSHTHLDLLKIDIEGAEYTVLQQLLTTKIRPSVIAVEFDQPVPVTKTIEMIKKLMNEGYDCIDQTGWNFIFKYRL